MVADILQADRRGRVAFQSHDHAHVHVCTDIPRSDYRVVADICEQRRDSRAERVHCALSDVLRDIHHGSVVIVIEHERLERVIGHVGGFEVETRKMVRRYIVCGHEDASLCLVGGGKRVVGDLGHGELGRCGNSCVQHLLDRPPASLQLHVQHHAGEVHRRHIHDGVGRIEHLGHLYILQIDQCVHFGHGALNHQSTGALVGGDESLHIRVAHGRRVCCAGKDTVLDVLIYARVERTLEHKVTTLLLEHRLRRDDGGLGDHPREEEAVFAVRVVFHTHQVLHPHRLHLRRDGEVGGVACAQMAVVVVTHRVQLVVRRHEEGVAVAALDATHVHVLHHLLGLVHVRRVAGRQLIVIVEAEPEHPIVHVQNHGMVVATRHALHLLLHGHMEGRVDVGGGAVADLTMAVVAGSVQLLA